MWSNSPVRVAIVLEVEGREIVETLARDAGLGERQLFPGQRDAVEARAVVPGDGLGEAAPAAADLEHAVAGLDAGHVGDAVVFGALCVLERLVLEV